MTSMQIETFAQMAALRAERTRKSQKRYDQLFAALSLADMCAYWQYMIENHARTLREAEHFGRMKQRCQESLFATMF